VVELNNTNNNVTNNFTITPVKNEVSLLQSIHATIARDANVFLNIRSGLTQGNEAGRQAAIASQMRISMILAAAAPYYVRYILIINTARIDTINIIIKK
jgi:hypothetical protein